MRSRLRGPRKPGDTRRGTPIEVLIETARAPLYDYSILRRCGTSTAIAVRLREAHELYCYHLVSDQEGDCQQLIMPSEVGVARTRLATVFFHNANQLTDHDQTPHMLHALHYSVRGTTP
jgi:hypothetical protein